jgi:hypothetical protein
MVPINPLIPQSWGTFLSWGTPPDPRYEVSCASFSAVSIGVGRVMEIVTDILPPHLGRGSYLDTTEPLTALTKINSANEITV